MDYQWLMFAFLLVFLLVGAVKALWHPLAKNVLRLACVPFAFFFAWLIQIFGGFQAIATSIATPILASLSQEELSADTEAFITASASTLISSILFGVVFMVFLTLLRLIAAKLIYKAISKRDKDQEKAENAGFKALSILSGAMGGFLVLGVMLMPMFYVMDIASCATSVVRDTECDDSQIWRVAEVIDNDVVEPYEKGITTNIYKYTGISYLMNSTTSLGGRIETDSGDKTYATKTLKTLLSNGVDLAISFQSEKSNDENLSNDLEALLSDPVLISVVSDIVIASIEDMEIDDSKVQEDLMSALVISLKEHYSQTDKSAISNDVKTLGNAVVYLNEQGHLMPLITNPNVAEGLGGLINDQKSLEGTVDILTGVSSYDILLEKIYEFEIESLSNILEIPHNDKEAYDVLVQHLLDALNAIEKDSIKMNNVQYFVEKYAASGESIESIFFGNASAQDEKLYANWQKYQKGWKSVQDAFSASCEDTTLGSIWVEFDGNMYFYDGKAYTFTRGNEIPKDYSPVSPLCQYLVVKAVEREAEVTYDILIEWLEGYDSDTSASSSLAKKIVNKEEFVSNAVTLEKMLASADFTSWDEETRRKDSKLIVQILMKLKTVATGLSGDSSDDDYISSLTSQLGALGETLDIMCETSCIKELPSQLTEGMLQNDMFRKYINAGIVKELNDAVKDHDDMTYTSFMHSIEGIITLVIDKVDEFGGVIK